jgi:hypothetical protein
MLDRARRRAYSARCALRNSCKIGVLVLLLLLQVEWITYLACAAVHGGGGGRGCRRGRGIHVWRRWRGRKTRNKRIGRLRPASLECTSVLCASLAWVASSSFEPLLYVADWQQNRLTREPVMGGTADRVTTESDRIRIGYVDAMPLGTWRQYFIYFILEKGTDLSIQLRMENWR